MYDKYDSLIIGFVNVGHINNHLPAFEEQQQKSSSNEKPHANVATHTLVFMVRGIFSFHNNYGQFPCSSLSGDILFPIVWECVRRLKGLGFKVIAITCDGASSNRKFFKLNGVSAEKLTYKTVNVFSEEKRPLFFLSDVPHLIKTVRNNWSNSFGHSSSRTLSVGMSSLLCTIISLIINIGLTEEQGKHFMAIVEVYHQNQGDASEPTAGLSIMPKIKLEHIKLTSYSRMRVDLAAQVLSNKVSKAIEANGHSETAKFCSTSSLTV